MNEIPTSKISEILEEEFMAPLHISAYFLAQQIGVPTSRIQDLLHDRRQVTVDTSLRLGRFFGVSDRYFLELQNDIEIRNLKQTHGAEYAQIKKYQVS
ncbi:HigA family addiction module antitoxin [Lactiplantibacillus argentoratensis]|uniref:HigA family addiction module antitoxin n=1 Tax=Lactiplantibacillus argentoratensis TaxID=271881 RepID=UPI003D2B20DA